MRPTPSLVKNALFNILGDISGLIFLDLFAGTGQIGLEAQRRGARVIFVEKNPKRVQDIKKKTTSKVVKADAVEFLRRFKGKAHIIFADPPYNFDRYEDLIREALKVLDEGGVFILEHFKKVSFEAQEERKYGDTVLSFWRKEG